MDGLFGSSADDDNFTAQLFFDFKRFFNGKFVIGIYNKCNVRNIDFVSVRSNLYLCSRIRNKFDTNDYLHVESPVFRNNDSNGAFTRAENIPCSKQRNAVPQPGFL